MIIEKTEAQIKHVSPNIANAMLGVVFFVFTFIFVYLWLKL
jgi:hypothetical protein